jgi:nicotinate-nucleotide adenylyltransferase
MKLALFGGAFDPPHLGHQQVAHYLLKQKYADEVWFVPVFKHPWAVRLDKELLTPYAHRLHMIKSITGPKILVKEFRHVSFVYPTVEYFKNKYPQHQFAWTMGSEYLSKFNDFLKDHPHLKNIPFLVYPRENYPLSPLKPNMIALHQAPLVTIKSTQIRQKVCQGKSIINDVPPPVAEYIKKHRLYQLG